MAQHTFADYAAQYLAERQFEVAPSTLKSVKSKVKNLVRRFGNRPIAAIRQSDIKAWKIKAHKKFANKTINEHFTVLRAIFSSAQCDGVIVRNPMDGLNNLAVEATEPLPFTKSELTLLVEAQTKYQGEQNLCLANCATGLRISESIALDWDCVDFERRQIDINKCKVLGGYKVPKTASSLRTIEMNPHVVGILKRQYLLTGHLRAKRIKVLQADNKTYKTLYVRHVFLNTKTGKPFIDSRQYAKSFFTPFLKALDIKHRGPNQPRHTFASHCLTAGISKEWVARQLGHEDTTMVDKHYSRWLKEDAPNYAGQFYECMNDVFGVVDNPVEETLSQSVSRAAPSLPNRSSETSLGLVGQLLIALEQNPALASTLQQALNLSGGAHD
ncbi:tyrosine-type recombinase/integrase [Photobacterium lutimaris]|uniref:Site-specific integrase n=1 Tax=Photobacterium lutimaris TaxID=388278 RepID=A0A2T3IHN5_9GAMM|nr:site-specific integrase [Photobacterium lutimaris]PSU27863.1 site-specific integrase [Photobacterium lutimaris]TDR69923.1 integrase [Photobacterium lutimaris]